MITPDLSFWMQLLARLALEAACVASATILLESLVRAAFWRRTLWQSAVVCLLLLTASELSGFGRGMASYFLARARPEPKPVTRVHSAETTPFSLSLPTSPLQFNPAPADAPVPVPTAIVKTKTIPPLWWPGLLWLTGGLAVLGRVMAAQILFVTLRRRRSILDTSELNGRVAAVLHRLAVRRKICLLESQGLSGPIAFGVLRPSIGLPVDFTVKYSQAEQDAMLAHELAHLASRDPLWYLLADVSSAALWWHPQAWWARRRLHRASELAADEAAAIFPGGPAVLAGCLVTLGRQMTQQPAGNGMGVEGGGFRSDLGERVQCLLRLAGTAPRISYGWPSHAARLSAILSLSAVAIVLSGCLQSRHAEKPATLPASLSQAWDASPASTLWGSTHPAKDLDPLPAPSFVKVQLAKPDESIALPPTNAGTTSTAIPPTAPPTDPAPSPLETRMFHGEPKSLLKGLYEVFPVVFGGTTLTRTKAGTWPAWALT
jgi:beta-lactamase regulating signal transducer with metallopeptidase domain